VKSGSPLRSEHEQESERGADPWLDPRSVEILVTRFDEVRAMLTVLVINSKGGCGKTTVTTNLASYFAAHRAATAIMDYDPQGSSLRWLRMRPPYAARIHGANAAPQKGTLIRSLEMAVPSETDILFIDAPAGVKGLLLQEIVRKAELVLVPVGPSPIDLHATADFVKDLLLVGRVRVRNTKVAVIANRVRSAMPVYEPLERFLGSLGLPFLTRIRDSDTYITAAEKGLGVFEMDVPAVERERQELLPVVQWLESHRSPRGVNPGKKVFDITDARRLAAV
jgi:chromosome partitioning protein